MLNITPINIGNILSKNSSKISKKQKQDTDDISSFENIKTRMINESEAVKTDDAVAESSDNLIYFSPNSSGGRMLTEEQRRCLSERYDVTSITMREKHKLFGELTTLGVLSYHDMSSAMERDIGTIDLFSGDAEVIANAGGVFSAKLNYSYENDFKQNWVERHQELSSEEWRDFAASRQNGHLTNGIGGEFDAKIAGILVQLV